MDLAVPHEWWGVLSTVQRSSRGAFLAGGALRDLRTRRPIKDVDIFVGPDANTGLLDVSLHFKGYRKTTIANAAYFSDDESLQLATVYEKDGQLPVNIIQLSRPMSLHEGLERLDWGFCQIGTDGGNIIATEAHEKDIRQSTMTLCRCQSEDQYVRSMERAKRLRQKFVNWRVVVPEQFERFIPPSYSILAPLT
ncbi:hypothetical protein [Xanthobacter wiegelii]|uniref:hypothetical protein n=1 Tax=Xanthobacter wiegelii TaxID=3119913 RepID=UPI003726B99E